MSATPKDTLGGATKKDIALAVSIGFLGLFGLIIIVMLLRANYDLSISGTLDATLIWATFIGIVMSTMMYLGFKQGQSSS